MSGSPAARGLSRRGIWPLAMLVVLLASTACANTVTGNPVVAAPAQEQVRPQTYGFDLIGSDVASLEVLERARRIDPCAVLPRTQIEALGTMMSYGTRSSLDSCTAEYRPKDADERRTVQVEFSLAGEPYKPVKVSGFDREVLKEDREARYGCDYYFDAGIVPSRLPSIRPLYGKLSASSYSIDNFDSCAALKPLVPAAMNALAERPGRAGGSGAMKLAAHDPCEFLSKANRDGLKWSPGSPYDCRVTRERGSGSVRYRAAPVMSSTPSGMEAREVGGRKYFVRKLDDRLCYVRTFVGDEVEISTKDASRPVKVVGSIEADEGTGNCDVSIQWAQWAAELATK